MRAQGGVNSRDCSRARSLFAPPKGHSFVPMRQAVGLESRNEIQLAFYERELPPYLCPSVFICGSSVFGERTACRTPLALRHSLMLICRIGRGRKVLHQ